MTEKNYLQVVKESFDPKLINALFKNFSNQYIALQELIDNAVDDKLESQKLTVTLTFTQNKVVIKNFKGSGMGLEDLMKFFTWGGSEKEHRIGRYGQGGKAALGYLANSFVIRSHPVGSESGYLIRVDDWEDRSSGFKTFDIEPFDSLHEKDEGFVSFEISNLRKEFEVNHVKDRIATIYRPLIVGGDVEFIVDGDLVECVKVNYDEGTRETFKREIKLKGKEYCISGEYGIVSDPKSPRGGFSVYQFGRRVGKKEYFEHIDPSKRWNVERLYGELYIDFEIPLLMNKTDLDRDSTIWNEISQEMHEEINSIMKLVIDYKTPTKKEKKNISKIDKQMHERDVIDGVQHVELGSYGPNLLFKEGLDRKGEKCIKINRDHKAYKNWTTSKANKDLLYAIMVLTLYETSKKVPKKEAAMLVAHFAEDLKDNTYKMLP